MSATEIKLESSSVHDSAAVGGGMTPRERILLLPEDHIGSVEKCTRNLWVFEGISMKRRLVTYVPGLYKIFDDIVVYAAGNKQHDPSMDSLRVDIDVAKCRISIYYNGQGVPIELHPEEGVYMPEMVFGDLSNNEEIAGGRNSYGVKLANLFSTEFSIEIVDSRLERKYKQIFSENMGKKSEPEITVNLQGVNWTRITFMPDLAKFHMTHLDDDIIALLRKRVADMVAFLGISVQLVLNGQMFQPLESFSDYICFYLRTASEERREVLPRVRERVNDQFEVCVTRSKGTFQQVSFANKFATIEGGTHVDYVSNQIVARIVKMCSTYFQVEECDVEESVVKRHLWVFVNAFMDNPTFSSPTRDALTTPQESFGSSCEFSDMFINNVFNCIVGVLPPAKEWNRPSQARKALKEKGSHRNKGSV